MKLCMGCMTNIEDNCTTCPHCGYDETTLRQESYYLDPGAPRNPDTTSIFVIVFSSNLSLRPILFIFYHIYSIVNKTIIKFLSTKP